MKIIETLMCAFNEALEFNPDLKWLRKGYNDSWFCSQNVYRFVQLYHRLEDEDSKEAFLKVLKNSIGQMLAGDVEKFRYYNDEKWSEYKNEASRITNVFPSYPEDLVETFILHGYRYKEMCVIREGDIILDCGAYTGNTSLDFARNTGNSGIVYAFEPIPDIFKRLVTNLEKSEVNNVYPHNMAVLDKAGDVQFVPGEGGSTLNPKGNVAVTSISIDEFVETYRLPHVDFIKMDIECTEREALKGAANTIRKFTPKLAICIYHRWDDFVVLPDIILGLNRNYRFYFKHNCYNFWESVLFAVPHSDVKPLASCDEEARISAALYSLIVSAQENRIKQYRETLLKLYDAELRKYYTFLPHAIYFTDFTCLYYPISRDGNVHYKFAFTNDNCQISLYIEEKYDCAKEIINHICAISNFSSPLTPVYGKWNGCLYTCSDIENIDNIVMHMRYLFMISFSKLVEKKLVDDRIVFDSQPLMAKLDTQFLDNTQCSSEKDICEIEHSDMSAAINSGREMKLWNNTTLFDFILDKDMSSLTNRDWESLINTSQISMEIKLLLINKYLSDRGATCIDAELSGILDISSRAEKCAELLGVFMDFSLEPEIRDLYIRSAIAQEHPDVILHTMQKNEGYLLLLWIFYHLPLVGREGFVILDNGSTNHVTKKILHILTAMQIKVIYRYNEKKHFLGRGMIQLDEARAHCSQPFVSLPTDIDEFLCINDNGRPNLSRDDIRAELARIHQKLAPDKPVLYLESAFNTLPYSYKVGSGKLKRVACHREYREPDIGWGLHGVRTDATPADNVRLSRLHFHCRPYKEMYATVCEKLKGMVDINNREALKVYRGGNHHLVHIILDGESGYSRRLEGARAQYEISVQREWANTGLPYPFLDPGRWR